MDRSENPAGNVKLGTHKVENSRLRLDKWLWAARFYKTRNLANAAIEAGQVRIGEERVKPAHAVRIGNFVTVRKNGLLWALEVVGLSGRRGGASDAALLYRESAQTLATREEEVLKRKASARTEPTSAGRPTKRDRRRLIEFLEKP